VPAWTCVTSGVSSPYSGTEGGVKLTTVNDEIAGVLREIEAMGVEIYSCGTCLKHYDLESSLKVGKRGTTNHIVEGLQDFDKVVWV